MEEEFISWAKHVLGGDAGVTKEKHGDQSQVFKICIQSKKYFLKIGMCLDKECVRLNWLKGKLSVPVVIDFKKIGDKDALLLSAIDGSDLVVLKKEWHAIKVVDKLAEALRQFHSFDANNCPFGNILSGNVLIHGDACLPNFIFKGENFNGYIDLGDMRVDVPDVDFAAAIWSLQHNLGYGYGLRFLEQYGVKNATEEMADKFRLQYEDMQKE